MVCELESTPALPDFSVIFSSHDENPDGEDEIQEAIMATKATLTCAIREYCHSINWEASSAHDLPDVVYEFGKWVVNEARNDCSGELVEFVCVTALQYDDLKYVVLMQAMHWIRDNQSWQSVESRKLNSTRLFGLLSQIPAPISKGRSFCLNTNKVTENLVTILKYKKIQSLYSDLWHEFCKIKLPEEVLKEVLSHVSEEVMQHMTDATVLTDIYVRSVHLPSPMNLMALQGLFRLINQYNLDYPDFYAHVYGVVTPSLLHCSHRERLVTLLDSLMSSTHLPGYVVCAFAKRVSRLCLVASLDVLGPILSLVHNWVVRNSCVQTLVHREKPECLTDDPYLEDEVDPAKSNATLSSLWEVKTMANHFHHSIHRSSSWIAFPLPPMEKDLNWKSHKQIWSRELKKPMVSLTNPQVPTNFLPPTQLFTSKHFEFGDYFQ